MVLAEGTRCPLSRIAIEHIKKGSQTRFLSLVYDKGTAYDLEHSRALYGIDIGVLISKRLGEVCSSDRTEKPWVQYFKLVANIRLFVMEGHSDWHIQVHSVLLMVRYLRPALYLHYARSAQAYPREMRIQDTTDARGVGTSQCYGLTSVGVAYGHTCQRNGTYVLVSSLTDMDDAPSAKDAEHFRLVASSREGLIENTLMCPCLNRSSRRTPQIRWPSSLSSLRV